MEPRNGAPPGLREQIGVSVGAPRGTAVALDKVAALGAATLNLPSEPQQAPLPASWHKDRRLAGLLWRLRGGDRRARGEAAIIFARRLRKHRLFKNFNGGDELLLAFALRIVIEWDDDRCKGCGGTMLANPDPNAAARNTHRTKRCDLCKTRPGHAMVDHGARARALGIAAAAYEKHWLHRFDQAHALLDAIEPKIESPLQKQSGKRSIAGM